MSLLQESFQMLSDKQSMRLFNVMLASSQAFGGIAVFLVAIWMGGYEDGFAWSDDPERQFHYHPTFMTMGLIFLYGEALLVYRVFRNERKRFSKLLHLTLHTMVLIFMIIALKAVWDSHDYHRKDGELDPIPNLYSLHSWIGITVVITYCIQYVSGFTTFFFPGLSIPMRQFVMPFHQAFGLGIFCFVAITASMGISERAAWHHTCWTQGKELCGEQAISNLLGLSILMYCGSVVIIVLNPRWRRRPLPEEESLHQLTSTD
uniref:Cytochrome b561 domain-containing protein n=1 Tax=Parascaris univalens TaxID=6257 RepID=A0A915BK13_PARUN